MLGLTERGEIMTIGPTGMTNDASESAHSQHDKSTSIKPTPSTSIPGTDTARGKWWFR